MRQGFRWAFPLLLLLGACANPRAEAERLATTQNMRPVQLRTDAFTLSAFVRQTDPSGPLVIYVEGDGRAWLNRSTPSSDPTPHAPVALWLAVRDPSPNVAYVARPCQYAAREQDAACASARYWTSHRFAEEVVAATSQAVDQLKGGSQRRGVHLVGFSGGAAIAALVAARRDDVLSLRTVAGNLDNDAFARLHKVSAMPNSLDAVQVAARLAKLPQVHLVGARDETVPRAVVESYVRAMGSSACVSVVEVAGASHEGPWQEAWSRQPPASCR